MIDLVLTVSLAFWRKTVGNSNVAGLFIFIYF